MLSGFFVNITILTAFIFLFHRVFYKTSLTPASSLRQKAAAGTASGLLGVVLLLYSIPLSDDAFIDLRMVPVALMALFGGWVPAVISGTIIIAGRLLIDFSTASVASFFLIVAGVVSFSLIHTFVRRVRRQAAWMVAVTSIYISILLFFILPFQDWLFASVAYLIASTAGMSIAVYMFIHLTKVNQMFNRYYYQAYRDHLTNLYNQRAYQEMFQLAKTEYSETRRPLSLLMLEIDYFKQINDTYGHPDGDAILKQFSEVLLASIRPSDDAFRIGGEEFAVLLHDCEAGHAETIAERIRTDINRTAFIIQQPPGFLSVTVSIGAATYPAPGQDISVLHIAADDALYQAKHLGRNRICSYRPSGQEQDML